VVHDAFEHGEGSDPHGIGIMDPVADPANPVDDPADAAALARYARALADVVVAALPGWVERSIAERFRAWSGDEPSDALQAAGRVAAAATVDDLEGPLRELLDEDVDVQRSNPLAVVRRAVVWPTAVLRAAGVPPVVRDAQAERLFPDDDYDLTPASFGDLHPDAHEPGLEWGAAKAHIILSRRRREGRR
jgi:hypothetical protein